MNLLRKWSLDLRGGGYPTLSTPAIWDDAPPAGLEPATLRVAATYNNQGPDSANGDLIGHVRESNVHHGAPAGTLDDSNSCVSVPLIMPSHNILGWRVLLFAGAIPTAIVGAIVWWLS